MNQTHLAQLVGVSQQFISKLLKGERRPKWHTAKHLAQITSTTPQFWMEGKPCELQAVFKKWAKQQRQKITTANTK